MKNSSAFFGRFRSLSRVRAVDASCGKYDIRNYKYMYTYRYFFFSYVKLHTSPDDGPLLLSHHDRTDQL